MRISIHQPQYIPWLPYFAKIAASDLFIFLDTVAFQKNGLQNRNAIKSSQGALWLTVPIQQKLGTPIREVRIAGDAWRDRHRKTLEMNYRKAPYYNTFMPDLENIYARSWELLSPLNIEIVQTMLRWLKIRADVRCSSDLPAEGASSDLILAICRAVSATTYVSGTGGRNYLREEDFAKAGIRIEYAASTPPGPYPQLFSKVPFVPSLSALDVIFNCGPDCLTRSAAEVPVP